ncbi:T20D4.11-like domain-containing protein [Caenorhabditis elegans]|uniref:T20D4.11-like domain-containing protein n=1 Tax=Caenorhabditis elegans TaxID=6239 RepID=P91464_CAEEL|nr:DUF19 domain-containing protein [Caenorhabditis elegans]CCD62940.1 DUF19 domain-containing protein [Caenorhabditis elegans]|eukprot:NP_503950.1 Uncharacterized protein CELE_T20D4.11 [Caenorhabditis elegans]
MRGFFKLALLASVLLALAYGDDGYNEASELERRRIRDCPEVTFKRMAGCVWEFGGFLKKVLFLDLEQRTLDKFRKSCVSMATCFDLIECKETGKFSRGKRIKDSCDVMNYLSKNFVPCLRRLEKLNPAPTCFKKWKPFYDLNEVGPDTTPEEMEELCKNMLGKDNCMKDLVGRTCGGAMSQELVDRFEETSVFKQCDAD